MNHDRKEFISTMCNAYIVLLVLVLPLYTQGTYYLIGDSKYILFRNITIGFLLVWVVYTLFAALSAWMSAKRRLSRGQLQYRGKQKIIHPISWSIVDRCMILYGGCALLSMLASPYRETAWNGYKDWYMGALTQLLFVGIYFFVSREYTRVAYPIRAGEMGLLLVAVIAFLQRFGVDVCNLHGPYVLADWESSHMLSTIGNINWLCGYLCVLLPWPVVGFFYSSKKEKQIAYYIVSVLALTLTLTQGSDMGILVVAACLGMGVLYGMKRPEFFRRSVLLALGMCVICPVMGYMMKLLGTWDMLAVDGFLSGLVTKPFWWILALLFGGIYLLQRRLSEKQVRWFHRFLLIGAIILALGFVFVYWCSLPEGEAWGSGRGGLWHAAWMGFCEADGLRKIIGFGSDCFAEYIYSSPAISQWIQMQDHWANSIFANAHNEWLNMLINGGVLGVVAYLGLFVSGLKRYREMMLGVMVLILYAVNSMFSFQQVMSTPYLFLVLGLCESKYRETEESL
uniref:O-antigen ligase family protein n=1 Tax=Acetatifactor sp. TaxID=1872090 RepID=UPI0040564D53